LLSIHRNKIRTILVDLVEGCSFEVAVQNFSNHKPSHTKDRLITFGSSQTENGQYFSTEHYVTDKGKTLNINTFYDTEHQILSHTPYFFKIVIPEGCRLKFEFSPQLLGFP